MIKDPVIAIIAEYMRYGAYYGSIIALFARVVRIVINAFEGKSTII